MDTLETAKANLAEIETTVAVLRKLLAEAEAKAAVCKSLVETESPEPGPCEVCGAPMRHRSGPFGTFLGCSRFPSCKHKVNLSWHSKTTEPTPAAKEPEIDAARETHNETHRALNHRSASAANAFDLKEAIREYLNSHGQIGERHSWTNVWTGVQGQRWGKEVFTAMINELVAANEIVFEEGVSPRNNQYCRHISLKVY